MDEGRAWAERLDGWIAEERVRTTYQKLFLSLFHVMLGGAHTSSFAQSATMGAEDFFSLSFVVGEDRGFAWFLLFTHVQVYIYPLGINGREK